MATNGTLAAALRSLKLSRYLQGNLETQTPYRANVELLLNGQRFCEHLSNHWRNTDIEDQSQLAQYSDSNNDNIVHDNDDTSRLSFVKTREFAASLENLHQKLPNSKKKMVRTVASSANKNGLLDFTHTSSGTLLVTDYFLHPSTGFNEFHSIQRERKIWWMRCSANPSRYSLEAFKLEESSSNCHSATIQSRFQFGTVNIESVTLVPLKETLLQSPLPSASKTSAKLPAVVRSVVDLEASTCALLLDGCDHIRPDMLLLHRKLAPYQCWLACLHTGQALDDFCDLSRLLTLVLQRAGLRIYTEKVAMVDCKQRLQETLDASDNMGIPYVLLIEDETLRTGLLKLRSRDTTLSETIHISDIPGYLLHIFRC